MEGGSAEQCWSREKEGVFISDVLVTVHIKTPLKMSITGGSHSSTASVNKQGASVNGLYTSSWLKQTASVNRPLTLAVFLHEPPV